MKKEVTLNNKEQKRLLVMNEVVAGRMTGQQAADMLGITLRHTRRILASYRQESAAALAHGNRGRKPVNKLDETMEAEIVRLAQGEYLDSRQESSSRSPVETYIAAPEIRSLSNFR